MSFEQEMIAAQERVREAQRAEQQRIHDANAGQRAIERAKSDLQMLEHARHQEQLSILRGANEGACTRLEWTNKALVQALDAGDVRKALTLRQQADMEWQAHRDALSTLLGSMNLGYFTGNEIYALAETHGIRQQWGWGYAVLEWIANASDPVTKRIRQGLAYAVGLEAQPGVIVSADQGYSAANAYRKWGRNLAHR